MSYANAIIGLGVGIAAVILIIAIACYVIFSYAHMKALKALGYDKAWLAWIPYGVFYACADVVTGQDEKVKLFGSLEIPAIVFKLWWIIPVAFLLLPLIATIENLITLVLDVVFLGCTYAKMYARLENKQENETQAIGCVSGFIQIIAVVKFLSYKGNN